MNQYRQKVPNLTMNCDTSNLNEIGANAAEAAFLCTKQYLQNGNINPCTLPTPNGPCGMCLENNSFVIANYDRPHLVTLSSLESHNANIMRNQVPTAPLLEDLDSTQNLNMNSDKKQTVVMFPKELKYSGEELKETSEQMQLKMQADLKNTTSELSPIQLFISPEDRLKMETLFAGSNYNENSDTSITFQLRMDKPTTLVGKITSSVCTVADNPCFKSQNNGLSNIENEINDISATDLKFIESSESFRFYVVSDEKPTNKRPLNNDDLSMKVLHDLNSVTTLHPYDNTTPFMANYMQQPPPYNLPIMSYGQIPCHLNCACPYNNLWQNPLLPIYHMHGMKFQPMSNTEACNTRAQEHVATIPKQSDTLNVEKRKLEETKNMGRQQNIVQPVNIESVEQSKEFLNRNEHLTASDELARQALEQLESDEIKQEIPKLTEHLQNSEDLPKHATNPMKSVEAQKEIPKRREHLRVPEAFVNAIAKQMQNVEQQREILKRREQLLMTEELARQTANQLANLEQQIKISKLREHLHVPVDVINQTANQMDNVEQQKEILKRREYLRITEEIARQVANQMQKIEPQKEILKQREHLGASEELPKPTECPIESVEPQKGIPKQQKNLANTPAKQMVSVETQIEYSRVSDDLAEAAAKQREQSRFFQQFTTRREARLKKMRRRLEKQLHAAGKRNVSSSTSSHPRLQVKYSGLRNKQRPLTTSEYEIIKQKAREHRLKKKLFEKYLKTGKTLHPSVYTKRRKTADDAMSRLQKIVEIIVNDNMKIPVEESDTTDTIDENDDRYTADAAKQRCNGGYNSLNSKQSESTITTEEKSEKINTTYRLQNPTVPLHQLNSDRDADVSEDTVNTYENIFLMQTPEIHNNHFTKWQRAMQDSLMKKNDKLDVESQMQRVLQTFQEDTNRRRIDNKQPITHGHRQNIIKVPTCEKKTPKSVQTEMYNMRFEGYETAKSVCPKPIEKISKMIPMMRRKRIEDDKEKKNLPFGINHADITDVLERITGAYRAKIRKPSVCSDDSDMLESPINHAEPLVDILHNDVLSKRFQPFITNIIPAAEMAIGRWPLQCPEEKCGRELFVSDLCTHIFNDHTTVITERITPNEGKFIYLDSRLPQRDNNKIFFLFLIRDKIRGIGESPFKDYLPLLLMSSRIKLREIVSSEDVDDQDFIMIWLTGFLPDKIPMSGVITALPYTDEASTSVAVFSGEVFDIRKTQTVELIFREGRCLLLSETQINSLTKSQEHLLQLQVMIN